MRNARFTGWGAAALAAVLVTTAAPAVALPLDEPATTVAPAPIETVTPEPTSTPEPTNSVPAEPTGAPEPDVSETPADEAAPLAKRAERSQRVAVAAAAAGFGDLTLTVFEDRYQDGIFDTTKVGRTGQSDAIRQYLGAPTLLAEDGSTWTATEVGDNWVFDDVPAGPAKLRVPYPTIPVNAMLFDATDPTNLQKLTQVGSSWDPRAEASVVIGDGASSSRMIGVSGLRAVADVKLPDGTPATGVTVELGANGQWLSATEYDFKPGSYEHLDNGYVYLLPGEFGVRVTPPAGYRVGEVTAVSSGGNIDPIPVTMHDGAYWLQTTDASTYTSNPTFTVTLEELPTGDVLVTSFDDRYPDGVFDTTKVSREGRPDEKNSRVARLETSQGELRFTSANAEGDYLFEDVPVGDAKVYFLHVSNVYDGAFFDATDATSADDIERLPNGSFMGSAAGVATVAVDEDGEELVVGMTALRSSATFQDEDGAIVSGVGSVEFGSGDRWFPATEWTPGTHEAFADGGSVRHLPDEIGLRFDVPDGYIVDEVTSDDAEIDVTANEDAYWIDTTQSTSYFAYDNFVVTLEELPTASVDVTYFADVELDGTYQADADTLVKEMQVYLHDAAGEWWATTAGPGGEYSFSGVAPGAATIYARIPEVPDGTVVPDFPELELPDALLSLWDATDVESYRDTVRADTETISFEGTLINPDGTTEPIAVTDAFVGLIDADLEAPQAETRAASQQVLIGGAFVFQAAAVVGTTGEPVEGVEVEFLSNAEQVDGTESDEVPGLFIATEDDDQTALFGTAEYGIAPTAPEGYEVAAVTAVSFVDQKVLDVTGGPAAVPAPGAMALFAADDEYRVDPTQLSGPDNAVIWAVVVAPTELPPVDPGTLPGTDVDPGAGLPAAGPAAAPRVLPATGSDMDPLVWMLGAGLLIAAGLSTRLVVRRRNS